MLQAKTEYGTFMTLASLTRNEITRLKKQTSFYCPACGACVIAKAGAKTIPHFAHVSKTDCSLKGGGESIYHEKGKYLLYQWLKYQNLDVQLEVYLPLIKQRPDILLNINGKTIAIEYQCSKISMEQIVHRNEGYYSQSIVPIWIMGVNLFQHRYQNHVKVEQFQRHLLHQFSSVFPPTLYYFCPDKLQFILFQDIYFLKNTQAIGNILIKHLPSMILTDLFQTTRINQKQLWEIWKKEKRKFRIKPPGMAYGRELKWQQWLYANHLHKETIPSIVYLPVSSQFKMKSPLWNWQSRLWFDVMAPLKQGETFNLEQAYRSLKCHFYPETSFPLINSESNPIYEYLLMLEKLRMIEETSLYNFTKLIDISSYKHIESSLIGDNYLMDDIINQNAGMNLA